MLLMTNVDNITCEQVPYLIEELMDSGAKNVHVVPAFTKKGRSEYIFLIDAEERYMETLAEFMALETGTLGVRVIKTEHYPFNYELRKIRLEFRDEMDRPLWKGGVSVKIVISREEKPLSARVEYEELKELSVHIRKAGLNLSMHEIKELIEEKALKGIKDFVLTFNEEGTEWENRDFSSISKKIYYDSETKRGFRN
ncbi:MAG: DUF111 family protein [Methanosarcinaceae archaeon]|nr:DUF111 family protein [Methanosarcinaceae archaeon]